MRLVWLLSVPYLLRHRLRSALTLAGVALGVAVLAAMHVANQSALLAFRHTVEQIAGSSQLQILAGDSGVEESVLEQVQAVAEVGAAAPVIEAVAGVAKKGEGSLLILGIDVTSDQRIRRYDFESAEEDLIDDPLVFLAQPDSLLVSRDLAARNGLRIGSRVTLATAVGDRSFTVRGVLRAQGMATAFGGNLAVMDIYAAQRMFGRGRRFDRIEVAARDGVTKEQCVAALLAALGPGFQVESPSARREHLDTLLHAYRKTVNLASGCALLVGVFLAYTTLSVAVAQRRQEIGVLRALGASLGQVQRLFLAEGALYGAVGSALGVAAGVFAARWVGELVSGLGRSAYGIPMATPQVTVEPWLAGAIWSLGVAASGGAAYFPARQAAQVDPAQALQKGRYQAATPGRPAIRVGAAGALAALLCAWLGRSMAAVYAGYAIATVSLILLIPVLAPGLARLLRPLWRRLRPVEGTLAVDSLLQAPRRTAATVAALMLSVAMVIGLGGLSGANYENVMGWVDETLQADLVVTPSENLAKRDFRLPDSLVKELETVEGLASVQAVRTARIPFRSARPILIATDIRRLRDVRDQRGERRSSDEAYDLVAEGQGAFVSDTLAERQGLRRGDRFELASPRGLLRLEVADVFRDYTDQQGSIVIDRAIYRARWADDSVNVFRLYLRPGAKVEEVRSRIRERLASERSVFVLSEADLRGYVVRRVNQWYGITYVQLAIAVLVAVIGIANTMTVSILDRQRELGILQAVGAVRRQVRAAVWMEAAAIGAIGLVLGLAAGAAHIYGMLEMSRLDFTGRRLAYQYPVGVAAALVPVLLAAAVLAAAGPAEAALRGPLASKLEYE
jgi:putative ABC transport system permease protein